MKSIVTGKACDPIQCKSMDGPIKFMVVLCILRQSTRKDLQSKVVLTIDVRSTIKLLSWAKMYGNLGTP